MRMMSRFLPGAPAAAVGLALLLPSFAAAQTAPRPQQNTALLEARKRVTEANEVVTQLRAEQKRVKDKLINDFSAKEEWKNTVPNLTKAKKEHETAKAQAERALQSKPEYKKLREEREALRKKLDELTASRNPDPNQITKIGTDLAQKGTALKKMESEAVETDEKALAAKDKLDKAQKEMDQLDAEVETALQSDPNYAAIQQQLEQAELQLAQAKESALQTQKSEAAARRASRPTQAPKPPRIPRGGGRGGAGADY
jgi:chromosome segregation ATPase